MPTSLAVLLVVVILFAVLSGVGAVVGQSVNEFTAFAAQYQARFDGLVDSVSLWFEARAIDPENVMLQRGSELLEQARKAGKENEPR